MMKNKEKKLTDEELRRVQLELMDKFDAFCRQHNLRYSLAFGTLLGAIRHKGFIPWDDDVDIIMPLPDMLRLKAELHSSDIEYHDIDTDSYYEYGFSRVSDTATYSCRGMILKTYGVCFDLYPVVGISEDPEIFIKRVSPALEQRHRWVMWGRRIVRYLPIKKVPGLKKSVKRYQEQALLSCPYDHAQNYYHAGSLRKVNIFDYDVFKEMCDVEFEGHRYMAVACWHDYLTHCFGNYMQLPPESERHPAHGFVCYWK